MKLSANFDITEMERDAPLPANVIPIYTAICQQILEPARTHAGCPLRVTSAYRPPAFNTAAHGQPNSEHMATSEHGAVDFYPINGQVRELFDWMRNNPVLPFHQLILETSANGSEILHVSMNLAMPGVRSVLTGMTNNLTAYQKVDHAPFRAS